VKRTGQTLIALMAAITIILAATGCSGGTAAVSYKPPFAPISLTIDSHGSISVHASASIVTPVGTFSVGMGVAKGMSSIPGATLLIIKHWKGGSLVDDVYKIEIESEEITVVLDGRTTLTVSEGRVIADASEATVHSLVIKSTAVPSASPVNTTLPLTDPLTSTHRSKGWPTGPVYPPPEQDVGSAIYCNFQPDGLHLGPSPSNSIQPDCTNNELNIGDNVRVSVTVTLLSDDQSGRSAANGSTDAGARISIQGGGIALGITPGGDWYSESLLSSEHAASIRTGVGATNTLALTAQGTHVNFYVNGEKVGSQDISGAPYSGGITFAGDEFDSIVFKDLTVESI
jgi:hypothetical protein